MKDKILYLMDKFLLIFLCLLTVLGLTAWMCGAELGNNKISMLGMIIFAFGISLVTVIAEYSSNGSGLAKNDYITYKAKVLPGILKQLFEECYYDAFSGFLSSEINDMDIVETGDLFSSYDYVVAKYKGSTIALAQVCVGNSGYSTEHEREYYLNGRVIDFDYPGNINGRIDIVGKNFGHPSKTLQNYSVIESGMPEFDKFYTIYTDVPEMVYKILDHVCLQGILSFGEEYYHSILFSIQNNHLFVALNGDNGSLRPSAHSDKKRNTEKEKLHVQENLYSVFHVMDLFHINGNKKAALEQYRRIPYEKDFQQKVKTKSPAGAIGKFISYFIAVLIMMAIVTILTYYD